MLSQDAIVSAAMLMEKDVVMLSPTANDDGIAALGNNIFQMNTTLGMLGAKIARYAIDNLNISDFAIFTPSSQYASSLTEGFKLEVEKSGRQIVDIETYEEGTKDFKAQFDKLKAILLERKQQRTQLEKSLNGEAVPQAGKPESKPVDTTYEIGGLFLPVEAEDAVMLAPQVQFHKIKTQMLGSLGWHNAKTVEDGKEYVVNTLFSTNLPASAAAETKEFSDFKALYKIKYGTDPDRIAAMGYDAASLIIAALRDAGSQTPTPTQISQYLGKVKGYKGASGMVSFDPKEHVNSETAIMKIKDKQFLRVQ
jgi:ABC-type branched-subunit amino acid transport system substrate-binding protein